MTARVVLFGTESTGKTTLARHLSEYFRVPWAGEYVRAFWDAHDGRIVAADLAAIARGQIDNEERAAARCSRLLLCDTDLITNTLWADLLFPGQCPSWLRRAAQQRSRHYALYLLCDTDVPFVPDGQRCFPGQAERQYCRELWRAALVDRGLPFVDICGSFAERFETAVAAIKRVTGVSPPPRPTGQV